MTTTISNLFAPLFRFRTTLIWAGPAAALLIVCVSVVRAAAQDSDGDGMPDAWELEYDLDPANPADGAEDPDGDGLTSADEYLLGTVPLVADTDGDGAADGAEVTAGTDPLDRTSHPALAPYPPALTAPADGISGLSQTPVLESDDFAAPSGPAPDLLAQWEFESANPAADSSHRGADGLLTGTAVVVDGFVSDALSCTAVGDGLEIPADADLCAQDLTVEAWVNPESTAGKQTIVSKWDLHARQWRLQLQGGRVRVSLSSDGRARANFTADERLPANTWTHIAFTHDSAADEVGIRINGETVLARRYTRGIDDTFGIPCIVGHQPWTGRSRFRHQFTGLVDELRVHAAALSEEQLRDSHLRGLLGLHGVIGAPEAVHGATEWELYGDDDLTDAVWSSGSVGYPRLTKIRISPETGVFSGSLAGARALPPATTFHARLRHVSEAGGTGEFSDPAAFTTDADSDGDGLADIDETQRWGTDPTLPDTDADGLDDGTEALDLGTLPLLSDTDGDGLTDGFETFWGLPVSRIAADSLSGAWEFDEGTGALAADGTGFGNHASLQNTSWIDGARGAALAFDGAHGLATVANDSVYKTDRFSLVLHLRLDALYGNALSGELPDGTMIPASQPGTAGAPAWSLFKTERNSLVFEVTAADGVSARAETADGFLTRDGWYHIAAVLDDGLSLYVDGEQVAQTSSSPPPDFDAAAGMTFGGTGTAEDARLRGALDGVRTFAAALSAEDVASFFDGLSDADADGLTAVEEQAAGSDPFRTDTDGDGLDDFEEYKTHGTDPAHPDTDGDGLSDADEVLRWGTNPNLADSDGDLLPDGWEIAHGLNPVAAPPDALAGHWKLDDPRGETTALDSSEHGNHGAYSGTDSVPGVIGAAREFDGIDDSLDVPSNTACKPAENLTVGFHLNLAALYGNAVSGAAEDGAMILVAQGAATGGNAYAFYKTPSHALVFELTGPDGAVTQVRSPDGLLLERRWYDVVGTFGRPHAELFVDGLSVASALHDATLDCDPDTGLRIGGGAEAALAGAVDDLRIHTTEMLPHQAAALGEAGRDPDEDGLSNYDELAAGTNPRAVDTDADGISDFDEIHLYGTDPSVADSDGDGLTDGAEIKAGTDPLVADTDLDGLTDAWEIDNGYDPVSADPAELAGLWSMDDAAGDVLADSGPHALHAAAIGGTPAAGILDGARRFDGRSECADVPASVHLDSSAFTASLHVQFDALYGNTPAPGSADGAMVLLERAADGAAPAWRIAKTERNSLTFILNAPDASVTLETADGFLTRDGWYHVAATFERPDARLYVDGTLVAEAAFDIQPALAGLPGPRMAGASDGDFLHGALDNVRIHTAALSADALNSLLDSTRDEDSDGLVNLAECRAGTSPHLADTNGDGLSDFVEVHLYGTDPNLTDTDGDGMPDLWEIAFGFDPLAPDDALDDPDGDGLVNLDEYLAGAHPFRTDTDGDGLTDFEECKTHGTDPAKTDSDGDGMPDPWEIDNGTNPVLADAHLDPDGEGLSNRDEYLAGTDPLNPDTDGDSVSDYEEVKQAHTDPLTPEFSGDALTVAVLDGADFTSALGDWRAEGTHAAADDRRGRLEYELDVPEASMCRVLVTGTHVTRTASCGDARPVDRSHIRLHVDGLHLGRRELIAPQGVYGALVFYTPRLAAGTHTLRLEWDNVHSKTELRIRDIQVTVPEGVDADGDGVRDWQTTALRNLTSLESAPGKPVEDEALSAYASPVCLEGRSRFPSLMSLTAAAEPVDVKPGTAHRWYADVPLLPDTTVPVEVSFQNGARTLRADLTWRTLNLLDEEAPAEMTLRVGDALRLTAAPQGATDGLVEIEIGDDAPVQTSVGAPVQHTFLNPGTVTVEGVHTAADGTQHTGELQVTVVDGAFPAEPPACMLGRTRIWNPGAWSENAVFDTDATVRAARLDDGRLSLTMKNVSDAHRILARAGDGGPVVDSTPLDGFCLEALADGYVWVMERYDDGSERWRQEVFERNLPPSVDIRIHVFIGGATLDDLTRERWIAHPDFSDIGVYSFDMLRSPDATHSTCHRIQTYQNGVPLGEAYYHQKLLPDEEQL